MPLVPITTPLTFSSDADTATIPDSTVYGGSNPARNTLAVYLELWKMDADSVATAITMDNDDPANVTSWTFDSSDDGWYKSRIYIVPDFNILTAYTIGQVVFYNDTLYICISPTTGDLPSNPTFYSETTLEAAASANNVTTAYQDYLVIEHGKKCAGDAAGEWYKSKDCSNCDKMDLMSSMLQKRAMVITAQRFASISQYNKAESIARKLETACESC
jgi:hypothetical protein